MQVKFEITDRDDKKALWVNNQNIWDVDKKSLTYDVEKAIIMAYFIGIKHAKQKIMSEIYEMEDSNYEIKFIRNDK